MVKLIDLTKQFRSIKVLNSITHQFLEQRIHGIIGLNGSGKTTLFNCMAGIINYDGKIFYKDSQLSMENKFLQFLPTHSYFFPRSTAEEYLKFIAYAKGLPTKNITAYNLFSLPLNQFIDIYSTGMQKKLAFSGLLMGDYSLYIFDEPFNGVDLQSNLILKQAILKLRDCKKTVFISSHILSSLTDICDEIHWLNDGKITYSFLPNEYDQIENKLLTTAT